MTIKLNQQMIPFNPSWQILPHNPNIITMLPTAVKNALPQLPTSVKNSPEYISRRRVTVFHQTRKEGSGSRLNSIVLVLCTPTCPCAKKRSVPATANVRIPIHEIAVVAAAANNNTFRHLILRSRNLFHGKYPSIAPWPCIDSSVVLYSQIKLVRPEHPGD